MKSEGHRICLRSFDSFPGMRSEAEMMTMILGFVTEDERIRIAGIEGSRAIESAQRDCFQDFDITCLVEDMPSFLQNDSWLDRFGKRIIMQQPEGMQLFPPSLGGWYTYLMLFEDGNRIDLKLVPLEDMEVWLSSDSLIRILVDKDNRVEKPPLPTQNAYLVPFPGPREFDDCCNEFWWVSIYVIKGLCRNQFLYAVEHLNRNVKSNLLRMLGWMVAVESVEPILLGKHFTYLQNYLSPEDWAILQTTYSNGTVAGVLDALDAGHSLFRKASGIVGKKLDYLYPEYDARVTRYIARFREDSYADI